LSRGSIENQEGEVRGFDPIPSTSSLVVNVIAFYSNQYWGWTTLIYSIKRHIDTDTIELYSKTTSSGDGSLAKVQRGALVKNFFKNKDTT
jgi:hypothetical protein